MRLTSHFSSENFATTPLIEADDWRQSQLLLNSPAVKFAKTADVKILAEGNAIRQITIMPTPSLLGRSTREPDPAAYVIEGIKSFLRVAKYGLSDDMKFVAALDVLESCVMLWPLDVAEPEIKYQCSCSAFWSKYKCEHSLAMSIRKKGVQVPPIYHIKNLGVNRKRGRPKQATPGDALVRYETGNRGRPRR